MEMRGSGKCAIPLTEEECKNNIYPIKSYKWEMDVNIEDFPTGCYVIIFTSQVSIY